eukprot:713876-Karenia_brevis.AAC.1
MHSTLPMYVAGCSKLLRLALTSLALITAPFVRSNGVLLGRGYQGRGTGGWVFSHCPLSVQKTYPACRDS